MGITTGITRLDPTALSDGQGLGRRAEPVPPGVDLDRQGSLDSHSEGRWHHAGDQDGLLAHPQQQLTSDRAASEFEVLGVQY